MSRDELIYGLHAVGAALRYEPHHLRQVWLSRGNRNRRLQELEHLLRQQAISASYVERDELDRLSGGGRHQGVVARLHSATPEYSERDLAGLLDKGRQSALLLVLDGIQDPHNLGACLRTADAAGVDAVIAPADRAVGLTATARKVASGAAASVPFVPVSNLARTLRGLRAQGLWLVGTCGDAGANLYESDLRGPLALVMGAEDKGLRRLTREHCDQLVHIPMAGRVGSLNVSVATGIVLFEAVRQRSAPIPAF